MVEVGGGGGVYLPPFEGIKGHILSVQDSTCAISDRWMLLVKNKSHNAVVLLVDSVGTDTDT